MTTATENLKSKYTQTGKEIQELIRIRRQLTLKEAPNSLKLASNDPININKCETSNKYVHYNADQTCKKRTILSDIAAELEECLFEHFGGFFIPIGPFADGTHIGAENNFAYLYELGHHFCGNLRLIPNENKLNKTFNTSYKISEGVKEFNSKDLFDKFATRLAPLVQQLELNEWAMEFGGFNSPEFCGLRLDQPTINILFSWLGPSNQRELLSMSFIVGILLPKDEELIYLYEVQKSMSKMMEDNQMTHFDLTKQLHLIPMFADDNNWFVTSVCLESRILQSLSEQCPLKASIRKTKAAIETFKVNGTPLTPAGGAMRDASAIDGICQILKSKDIAKKSEIMKYAHMMLPAEKGLTYFELGNSDIGINPSFVAHVSIQKAGIVPGAFSSVPSETIEQDLLAAIWQDLAADNLYRTPHCFLPYDIRMLSVASYAADNWFDVICITKEHCKEARQVLNPNIILPEVVPSDPGNLESSILAKRHFELIEELHILRDEIGDYFPTWQEDINMPDFMVPGYDQHMLPRSVERTTNDLCSPVCRIPPDCRFLDPEHMASDDRIPHGSNYHFCLQYMVIHI